MIKSYSRGHEIYYSDNVWKYCDNGEVCDDSRPCKRCNCYPTKEGYDACLGKIEGASHACCGHGVDKPYIM